MNITMLAFGTRGDVQPAIALGKALKAKGHCVRLAASANFKNWIEGHSLEATASSVDIQAVMDSEGGREWAERGNDPIQQMRIMKRLLDQHGLDMIMSAWNACQGAQVILSSFTSDAYAISLAEKLGACHISYWMQPSFVPTRSGAATFNTPWPDRDSILNYWFGKVLIEPWAWRMYGDITNRFRRDVLGLPPQTTPQYLTALRRILVVHGYSRHVVPHPADWPVNLHTTGYWFLDEHEAWQPPDELLRFLNAGNPPVCIGFGSMIGRDPQGLTRLVIEAVRLSGRRAVLLSGWAGVGDADLPSTVFRLEAAPHAWLFPHTAAVVHHGGAGTTAASLRAGVPTIIVPHIADQPFWGKRVELLGVGPKAIPRPQLTADRLAQAIRTATSDSAMQKRAAELGQRIRAEDGVGAAIKLIGQYLDQQGDTDT